MGKYLAWTILEDKFLIDNWNKFSLEKITKELKRTPAAVLQRTYRIKGCKIRRKFEGNNGVYYKIALSESEWGKAERFIKMMMRMRVVAKITKQEIKLEMHYLVSAMNC